MPPLVEVLPPRHNHAIHCRIDEKRIIVLFELDYHAHMVIVRTQKIPLQEGSHMLGLKQQNIARVRSSQELFLIDAVGLLPPFLPLFKADVRFVDAASHVNRLLNLLHPLVSQLIVVSLEHELSDVVHSVHPNREFGLFTQADHLAIDDGEVDDALRLCVFSVTRTLVVLESLVRQHAESLLVRLESHNLLRLLLHQQAFEMMLLTNRTSPGPYIELPIFEHLVVLLKMCLHLQLELLVCFDHDDFIHLLFLFGDLMVRHRIPR